MNILFQTKDLTVTSTFIAECREVSKRVFFVDMNNGKGITTAKTLDLAIDFAKAYQNLLG